MDQIVEDSKAHYFNGNLFIVVANFFHIELIFLQDLTKILTQIGVG